MPRRYALVNGSIYLGRGRIVEKGCVVFSDSLIEHVGPAAGFTPTSSAEVTDLAGKLVLPGLVDAHLHLVSYARSLIEPDLAPTRSLGEGLEVIRAFASGQPRGTWLTGRGWDKQRWGMAEFPTCQMLDGVAGDRPVALTSRDGHVAWLNTAGMRELGLYDRVEAVEGGEIVADSQGRPTGIFKENAGVLVWTRLGNRDRERTLEALAEGCRKLRRLGLVGAHTLEGPTGSPLIADALERGGVGINLVRIREVHEPEEIDAIEPLPGAWCVKTYADGTLGSQTASMLEPYCGEPDNFGIPALTPAKLREIVFRAVDKGFGVCVHAIGDRANREVLNAYEEAKCRPAYRGTLLRIEHAQVLDPDDIPRFARQGVVASMQPIHLVSDRHVADKYWGARSASAYAWKRIMDAGGTVAFGSDAPIESPDPLRGMHAAVTRSDPTTPEEGPWYPEERLAVWQAVDGYTLGSAAAARVGGVPDRGADGRIRAGAPANLTILDRDIIGPADPRALLDAGVVGTVVAGEPDFIR